MPPRTCPSCSSTSLQHDPSTGEYCCTACGTVVEESTIVSEVTFGESASGAAIVTGQFVGHDQAHAGSGGLYGNQGESRAQTLDKTRRRMQAIATKLHIQEHVWQMALNYFKEALSKNFVKGRKSQYVVTACLYLACRVNETPHMLMDFAEAIFVNVFAIGATYLQLLKAVGVTKLPIKDPSIFIQRFATQLDLEEDTKRVMTDASKLVQRMGKDWLTEGRRPTGIAAACVLLAARMNNIRISKAQIVQIAKVGEDTVQRRLDEFSSTSAGALSVEVFRATKIESAADPPSFVRHREQEKRMMELAAREKEALEKGEGLDAELLQLATAIDNEEQDRKAHAEAETRRQIHDITEEIDRNLEDVAQDQIDLDDESTPQAAVDKGKDKVAVSPSNGDGDATGAKDAKDAKEDGKDTTGAARAASKAPLRAALYLEKYRAQKAAAIAAALASGNDDIIMSNLERNAVWVSDIPDDPELLADVDDDEEVMASILNDDEVKIKSQVWMSMNRDYLIEQENKRLKVIADQAAGIYKVPKKRKRTKNKDTGTKVGPSGVMPTAAESATKMLQSRAFSKKLNYKAVELLFVDKQGSESPATPTAGQSGSAER